MRRRAWAFSAALCRGLIEAATSTTSASARWGGFPRLYAAASLKRLARDPRHPRMERFSAALCRGLIEAMPPRLRPILRWMFSAALCRGLIEAFRPVFRRPGARAVFRGFMPRPH